MAAWRCNCVGVTAPQPDAPVGAELAEEAEPGAGPAVGVDTIDAASAAVVGVDTVHTAPVAVVGVDTVDGVPAAVLPLRPVTAGRPGLRLRPIRAGRLRARLPSGTAARVLGMAVAGPVLASYAAVVGLVVLLSSTANAGWSPAGALRAAAPLWLAVHQVPLTIGVPGGAAAPLGVLPLLPTAGLAVLIARAASAAATRLDWRTPGQLAALAATFTASHAALGAIVVAVRPLPAMTAAPGTAIAGCAAISGLAAAAGGLRAAGFASVASSIMPPWAVRGVLAGLAGLMGLLAGGALCTLGGLILSAGTAHEVIAGWHGAAGGQLGSTVLSVAYLPNAVVAALSWMSGPGLSVGAVSVTPFGTSSGALPAVPLLAALPESGPGPSRVLVFALPVLVGVLVGRRCSTLTGDIVDRLHALVTAGATAAAGCFVLSILAGGRLGGGEFDPVRIPSASLAIAVFVWIVLPAGMFVALADRGARRAATVVEPDEDLGDWDEDSGEPDAAIDEPDGNVPDDDADAEPVRAAAGGDSAGGRRGDPAESGVDGRG